MKPIVIIQARQSSVRLPNKVILPINYIPIIEIIYRRVFSKHYKTVVAISIDKSDDLLCSLLKSKKIPYYRGSLINVKSRFLDICKDYSDQKLVVRLTADNIFPDKHLINEMINYFFKNKKKGIYIDVGCYHPYNGSNTKLLYDRGWSGINIDLDFHTIDFFNFVRKRDENVNIAISDNEGEKDLFFFHNRSAINSLSENRKKQAKEIRKIQTKTLNSVLENSKFKNEKINLLSIDVEGHEMEVLNSLNLEKYIPEMVLIEFLDEDIFKNLEFHNQNISKIINSEIYKYMIKNNYHFVNWLHSDLIFVHDSARN